MFLNLHSSGKSGPEQPLTTNGFICCLALWFAITTAGRVESAEGVLVERGDAGMVVSDSTVASRIGRDILREGGSAVDAAVATAFALAVSWPEAGNIGGGGFMIVRPANGKDPLCIDYRETAPQSMTATSFTKRDTTYTQKAVGVPGTVRGLAAAHARYGKLPWQKVVEPAAKLAADGVLVDEPLADSLNSVLALEEVKTQEKYAELRRVFGKPGDEPWQVGDKLVQNDLAQTLHELAEQGPEVFYTGRIAGLIVGEMKRGDGEISLEDLRLYSAKVRPAMLGTFRGYTIIGAPPPSSGGTCVIQALNILENFDLPSRDRYDPLTVHLIAEALRRVYADRARYLGDPDFVEIPSNLTGKPYAKQLAASIDPTTATPSDVLAPEIQLTDESPNTTHFSVIDADGMAVSNTYTLEASWGSRIVVHGGGFLLNNEMGDFNWFPGITNRAGRIGTEANTIVPGKRMLSSQSPTIVEKDGRVVLVTGSPGGRTIISTVTCILLNMLAFEMSAADAVAAPRMNHLWFPNQIELEGLQRPPHSQIVDPLRNLGHVVRNRLVQGSAHSISVDADTGTLLGVADFRRGGRPAAVVAEVIAAWEFEDPEGTELSAAHRFGQYQWSGDFAGSRTDGRDHFRIRGDASAQPMQAYLDLSKSDLTRVAVEVRIDAAEFAGLVPNEQLRITFAHDTIIPRVTARMIFGRTEEKTLVVRGEAMDGGTPIAAVTVSDSDRLERSIVLRMELDTTADSYRIGSREATAVDFTFHGTGIVAADREANYLGLEALNDFSSENEFVNLDRLELRKCD